MFDLSRMFAPVALGSVNMENYVEVPPSDILKPYIRCFWGSRSLTNNFYDGKATNPIIVIPDACMDVIFELDYVSNKSSSVFCGINDAPFFNKGLNHSSSIFAVRFYFWAFHAFTDCSMKDTLNTFADPQIYFNDLKSVLEDIMDSSTTIQDRITLAESYLINRLNRKQKINNGLMNAVYHILRSRGVTAVSDIYSDIAISERQLERIFLEYTGVSPKKAADLVRFQNVLQEILSVRQCDPLDIVYKYGFTDQPHLINNFRRYAGKTLLKTLSDIV